MSSDSEIVGRTIRVGGSPHRVLGVLRQISGSIQKGEPIGVEVDGAPSPGPSVR
ncbi:hypothetical protein ACNHKD_04800 [Methylocystis sp. JAN1]|uniref:hypothetical protein n=1 Tax=Methylocystis sp. JAN1 TaxID=3397211 RepID=UPI003FA2F437